MVSEGGSENGDAGRQEGRGGVSTLRPFSTEGRGEGA